MNLFHILDLPAYYGAITATLIGTLISNVISLVYLKRKMSFNYQETIKSIPRFAISLVILISMLYLFNNILPIDTSNRLIQILNLSISGIVCGTIYLLINFKHIKVLLPERILKKLKLSS